MKYNNKEFQRREEISKLEIYPEQKRILSTRIRKRSIEKDIKTTRFVYIH